MKFSIRDLMLVTVIVALVVGWWVDRSRLATERNRLLDESNLLGQYDANSAVYYGGDTELFILPKSPAPASNPPKP